MKRIKLTQGQTAIVDEQDYERINQFSWYAIKKNRTFYAARSKSRRENNGKQPMELMHKAVVGVNSNTRVYHLDKDSLNNMRDNLISK